MIQDVFQLQNPWRYKKTFEFIYHKRDILKEILKNLTNRKILGLVGSRQVGKSAILYLLIEKLIKSGTKKENIFYFNLDNFSLHELFEDINSLMDFIGDLKSKKYIFIDEVQRLKNPGLFLKEIYDLNLNIKIIFSGSSQIEIKSKVKEHLVGRLRQFTINRLSFDEYLEFRSPITKKEAFYDYLLYGSYPELTLAKNTQERKLILSDIYSSYIQKDIVEFLQIENVTVFNKLLIILASQIGNLLNINNISNLLKVNRVVVEKYISILESTFIIKLIYPFYKRYSKEVIKMPKIYFLDLGLRNLILNNFMDIDLRDDKGALFENFYLLELLNKDFYNLQNINFWRTTNQTEVDFIISQGLDMKAIEVKWENAKEPKSFKTLREYYPEMQARVVSKKDFL